MTKPFLKWAGGKRWLAKSIATLLGSPLKSRYVEPFLGGGAVFFASEPRNAILADSNEDLILAFQAVRDNPDYLIRALSRRELTPENFEKIRHWKPADPLNRAVRLLYLNKTAFNGLFRVNRNGVFNVPYGCKHGTKRCDSDGIRAASSALTHASLCVADFRDTLQEVRVTDTVYVDPPYTVRHDNNGFRRYNEKIFSWQDQIDLADSLNSLAARGVAIVVSNSAHNDVRKLYSPTHFECWRVLRNSQVAAHSRHRGPCAELVFVSEAILSRAAQCGREKLCYRGVENWVRL